MGLAKVGGEPSGVVDGDGDGARSAPKPPPRRRLDAEAIETAASLLRVIADPARIALLEALNGREGPVWDLAERVELPHKNVSHHLLALHQAGVLSRRRVGKLVHYALADWSAWWVVEQLARSVEGDSDHRP
jgi:DNA-binding transcriptional ArsR family regulator